MKAIVIALLCFTIHGLMAQVTITGKVIDFQTSASLPYATISIEGNAKGTITNGSGEFVISTEPSSKIRISHIGYRSQVVTVADVIPNRPFIVRLQPDRITLGEIIVTPTDPVATVKEALGKISTNYNSSQYQATGFIRETFAWRGEIVQLSEAVFEHTVGDALPKIVKARFMEDKAMKAPLWNPSRGGFYSFGWRTLQELAVPSRRNFLGVDLEKLDLNRYYHFEWENPVLIDNRETYVIAFDQHKNVKGSFLKGSLFIDVATGTFVKIKYEISKTGLSHLSTNKTWNGKVISNAPKKIDINSECFEITFERLGSKWYPHKIISTNTFAVSLELFGITQSHFDSLKSHSEFIVTKIDTAASASVTSNVTAIGKTPTLQNYLKQNFESYELADDWSDHMIIKSDTITSSIAAALHEKNTRWHMAQQQRMLEKTLNRTFTVKEQRHDLEYLKETLEKIHPGLFTYQTRPQFEASFKNAINNLEKNSEKHFLRQISILLASIQCGHTNALPSREMLDYHQQYGKHLPYQLALMGEKVFITNGDEQFPIGSEIKAINNVHIKEIVATMKSVVAADGASENFKSEFIAKYFNKLYAWYFSTPDTFKVDVITPARKTFTLNTLGISRPSKAQEREILTARFDSLKTVLLTIRSFSGSSFSTQLDSIFAALAEEQVENLIIDLRDNEGGRDEFGALLYAYLTKEDFKYYDKILVNKPDTIALNRFTVGDMRFLNAVQNFINQIQPIGDAFHYTQHQNLNVQLRKENAFNGKVYILINGLTFSTAAEFASITHSHCRATFIGEECGGAYLGNNSLGTPTLTLPNSGIQIQIPLGKYLLSVKEYPKAHLSPDVIIRPQLANTINREDMVLRGCLEKISKMRR